MSASAEPEVQPPSASEPVVLCPQCQARNDPALGHCSVCGAELLTDRSGRQHMRSLGIALVVVALLVGVVLPLGVLVPQLRQQMATRVTPTPQPTATTSVPPAVFREDVFSFSYPAGWWSMGPAEAKLVRMTSFKDLTSDVGSYIGGVFTEGVDNCRECARIVVSVVKDPRLSGTLTEAQYEALRAASEQALGARLLSQRRIEVSALPAVESVYLEASGNTKVWELMIVPPQPGVAYRVSCSSRQESFDAFEPVFRQAIATLHITAEALAGGPTRVPPPTPSPVPTPTAVKTYKVKAGDVLGQIAKDLGVSLEALAEANGLEDPYIIQPGQVLTVPLGVR